MSFHDGAAHRIPVDGREVVTYLTSGTSESGETFGTGVVVEVLRGGTGGDGDLLTLDQAQDLLEALREQVEQGST